jgi:hypothetical protein
VVKALEAWAYLGQLIDGDAPQSSTPASSTVANSLADFSAGKKFFGWENIYSAVKTVGKK